MAGSSRTTFRIAVAVAREPRRCLYSTGRRRCRLSFRCRPGKCYNIAARPSGAARRFTTNPPRWRILMPRVLSLLLLGLTLSAATAKVPLPKPLVEGLKNPVKVCIGSDGRIYISALGDPEKDNDG